MNDEHGSSQLTPSQNAERQKASAPNRHIGVPLSEASVAANTQAERSPGDWLIGTGMVLSFMLYYLLGNTNLPFGILNDPHVVPASLLPFLGLPFLLIFLILAWMRLPLALALFPLTLPYFQAQYPKTVYKSLHFSLAEIAIFALLVLALGQLVLKKEVRAYFSWQALRERLGPFLLPAAIFLLAACVSVVIAYSRSNAQVALRKEVLLPLLYVVLVLGYIRTPRQVTNLLKGLIGAGLMIGLFGVIQYFFMKNTLTQEADGVRIHTVYGNANNIGLFIDYGLPIALAWLVALKLSWRQRLLVLVLCLPMLISIFLTQSLGAWLALGAALLFIGALSLPNRKVLLIATVVLLVVAGAVLALYHDRILSYVFERHAGHGVGTAEKRIYLWQTAWHMIQDHPWFGVGLDNWLCHYSPNKVCRTSLPHYWITNDPVTGAWTGMSDEPTLSHPHNIFLHVWVSIGIFGLLAFIGVLILFFWTFSRVLLRLRTAPLAERTAYRWLVVGVGASMVAALVQGQIDSAFLEQDLAYCFWLLCAALLILRQLTQTSWWREKAR